MGETGSCRVGSEPTVAGEWASGLAPYMPGKGSEVTDEAIEVGSNTSEGVRAEATLAADGLEWAAAAQTAPPLMAE